MGNVIEIKNLSFKYEDSYIFNNFSCEFEQGKFYTILGPSGCGKTTLLNIIAGFKQPEGGQVIIDNQDMTNVSANKRPVNTIFQDYALFPHLNVFDNIAFGLKLQKADKEVINKKVMDALELVNLTQVYERNINELSGGQKQRVAIARAIVNEPDVLLLDEPLSALDLKLRIEMQYMLKELQKRLGITFIFITHDQEEALGLSDYIFVLNKGKVMQQGDPVDIYDEPANRFVADFIGDSNIIDATYLGNKQIMFNNQVFDCVDEDFFVDEVVDVVLRPEDLKLTKPNQGLFNVVIDSILFKGMHNEIIGHDMMGNEWEIQSIDQAAVGEEYGIFFRPQDIHVMKVYDEESLS